MKNKLKNFFDFFSLLILFVSAISCSSTEALEIDKDVILNFTQEAPKNVFVSSFDSIQFNWKSDTLERNISMDFNELTEYLQNEFHLLDTIKTNQNTKLYLKTILLADAVFSAFSLQMFGESYGLANDFQLKKDWNSLSLKRQFRLGNRNTISANCGYRTIFFKKLVRSLLHLPVRDTSIENIHTYPIVTIGNKEYLIDPSEPFVFLNFRNNKVLSFRDLEQGVESISFRRTKRNFGTNHYLISKKLYQVLSRYEGDINSQFTSFIEEHIISQNLKIPDCFLSIYERSTNIYPLRNENNAFAIDLSAQRSPGTILNQVTFYNSYFGIPCRN